MVAREHRLAERLALLGELHALVSDVALEVWHLILGARELIVGQDEDDVGLLGGVPHFSATSGRKYSCR